MSSPGVHSESLAITGAHCIRLCVPFRLLCFQRMGTGIDSILSNTTDFRGVIKNGAQIVDLALGDTPSTFICLPGEICLYLLAGSLSFPYRVKLCICGLNISVFKNHYHISDGTCLSYVLKVYLTVILKIIRLSESLLLVRMHSCIKIRPSFFI